LGWDSGSELAVVDSVVVGDGDGDTEPLSVTPLAMEIPSVEDEALFEFLKTPISNPSKWVELKRKGFGKYLEASYEGYEEVVTRLLVAIEARRNQNGGEPGVKKKVFSFGVRGKRELKGLVSSINYDSREDKQKWNTKGGTMLFTQ
jgi:hypothetical protein